MGIRHAVLVRHIDFPKLIENKDLGESLHFLNPKWFKKSKMQEPVPNHKGYHFLGETDHDKSLAVLCHTGTVWCPHTIKMRKIDVESTIYPSGMFSILDISGDSSHVLLGKSNVGLHITEALTVFKKDPTNQGVNIEPYGQAIAIVGTFSSEDVAVTMLEGNCSWIVGKEPTPSWSRSTRVNHSRWKEVLELTLALKSGVKVDLHSKKIQELILGYF